MDSSAAGPQMLNVSPPIYCAIPRQHGARLSGIWQAPGAPRESCSRKTTGQKIADANVDIYVGKKSRGVEERAGLTEWVQVKSVSSPSLSTVLAA